MTHRRTTIALAGLLAAATALPAQADGTGDAAVASFALQSGDRVQEVDLRAVREKDGDVLLLRVDECGRRGCVHEGALLRLSEGQLELSDERAELAVPLDGRLLRVTWTVSSAGLHLQGGRLQSDGHGGRTSADGFVGRGAEVQVLLDDRACAASGALGTSARFATRDAHGPLTLGALRCDEP